MARSRPLVDCVRLPVTALFVGINPGMRSAALGHHFAGYSNGFWKLLYASGLIAEPIGSAEDSRLPEWGLGLTNLIARPTPGIDTLRPSEYVAGTVVLRQKVRAWRPALIVFVGVTLYRAVREGPRSRPVRVGRQRELFEGVPVYVVPNPSGRNANFTAAEMLNAFRVVARAMRRLDRKGHRQDLRLTYDL
jgi:TDG/mug DNA glycosylase family protein